MLIKIGSIYTLTPLIIKHNGNRKARVSPKQKHFPHCSEISHIDNLQNFLHFDLCIFHTEPIKMIPNMNTFTFPVYWIQFFRFSGPCQVLYRVVMVCNRVRKGNQQIVMLGSSMWPGPGVGVQTISNYQKVYIQGSFLSIGRFCYSR